MARAFRIGDREIGPGRPCFVIAEAGVNHNGDVELARKLVDVAADAGADAVKFQTFSAARLAAASAPKAEYQKHTTAHDESQFDMLRRLELSDDAFRDLAEYCASRGILFLSTPFDEIAADFLESLGMAAYKVPSGEITNLPFLEHLARKGKPLIVSTGMCFLSDVEAAVRVLESSDFAILHCTSNYPADPHDVHLRAMQTMAAAFDRPVGYSDHTAGIEVSLAAVALGASVLEKHFTLDRSLPGPDHLASLEPSELHALITGIRRVEASLGSSRKVPSAAELNTAAVARKSLVAARPLRAGEVIDRSMLLAKRPGTGLPPSRMNDLIGKRVRRDIDADAMLSLDDFEAAR